MSTTTPAPTSEMQVDAANIVAGIAALLLISEDPAALTPRVAGLMAPFRLGRSAIIEAVRIAMIRPVTTLPETARRAAGETRKTEYYYRAAYIVQSAQRIHRTTRAGQPLSTAVRSERAAYQRHLDAQGKRATQAGKINRIAARFGDTLGWYAVMDSKTSAECRAANGKNFTAGDRPAIGYPGTVHPECRCVPGKPFNTSATVYEIQRGQARKSA